MMTILSLSKFFDLDEPWKSRTTPITNFDKKWHERNSIGKIWSFLKISLNQHFDSIVIYRDIYLAGMIGLLKNVLFSKTILIQQEFYFDAQRYSDLSKKWYNPWLFISLILHTITVRSMDFLIIHSSFEKKIYAERFKVSADKFHFIPYFAFEDLLYDKTLLNKQSPVYDVAAMGHHRDYECFIRAIEDMPWKCLIVAGNDDRKKMTQPYPSNLKVLFNVPFREYGRLMSACEIIVIPLDIRFAERSLGQITYLEAALLKKTVIAARTFQLADYASEKTIVYYEPGNAEDLRRQVKRFMADAVLREQVAENAFQHVVNTFTRQRYMEALLKLCEHKKV